MFPCMKISYTFCRHLGPQILSLANRKKSSKWILFIYACSPFRMDSITFKNLYPTLFNQMHYTTLPNIDVCNTYP